MQNTRSSKVLFLAQFSILLAIEAIFCFTPLGSIPITPAIVMTLAMIPVILTAILLGTKAGAAMGFFGGLFSFLIWTFTPPNPLFAFIFTPFYSLGEMQGSIWSLVICFVPRIMVGVVAGAVYHGMARMRGGSEAPPLCYLLSGVLGSMTNTVLVLGGTYLFFGESYAQAMNVAYSVLLGILGLTLVTNGLLEALLSAVAAAFVGRPVKMALDKRTAA